MKTWLALGFRGMVAVTAIAGWTGAAAAGLFSSSGPVIAILGGELYVGEARASIDRTGTITIKSQVMPGLSCDGDFTFGAKLGNAGSMHCTDGSAATFQFERIGLTTGHGAGASGKRDLTFTYGLNVDESRAYLKLPPGKSLGLSGTDVVMIDARPAIPGVILVSEPLP